LVSPPTDESESASSSYRLPPAEDLLDPFTHALAEGIAGTIYCASVDGAPAVDTCGVLSNVRGHAKLPAPLNEILAVEPLVGTDGDSSLLLTQPVQHPEARLALGMSIGLGQLDIDDQTVAVPESALRDRRPCI
jgi:hypothetical protein